jgi:hypothetical protein
MSDNIHYKDCFIKCTVKQVDENLVLDLPFQIYHQTIIENNRNHYCYLSPELKDKEVIIYIHYAVADEQKVKEFSGYLGNKLKDVSKNETFAKHWNVKKEDAFATSNELGVVTKYNGSDKLDIVHPYLAEELKEKE